MKLGVAVTGANGRMGSLIIQKILEQPDKFELISATVRDEKGIPKLKAAGVPDKACKTLDLYKCPTPTAIACEIMKEHEKSAPVHTLIIATSSVPVAHPLSKLPVAINKACGNGKMRPEYYWKMDQTPQQVDWFGGKAQVQAAREAGVKQVILLGALGGCDPEHWLNRIGEHGMLLLFKRKLEQYLINECEELNSSLSYTIIHAGEHTDGPRATQQLLLGVDDSLMQQPTHSIPREDLANLAVALIGAPEAHNRSFDVIATPRGEGMLAKIARLARESIAAVSGQRREPSVLQDYPALLKVMPKDCDYTINDQLHHVTYDPARTIGREETNIKLCCI